MQTSIIVNNFNSGLRTKSDVLKKNHPQDDSMAMEISLPEHIVEIESGVLSTGKKCRACRPAAVRLQVL